MLIFIIFSATNHLGLTTSPPIKAINKLHILRPPTKGSQNRQYFNERHCRFIYIIYPLSPQVTHAPWGYAPMLYTLIIE